MTDDMRDVIDEWQITKLLNTWVFTRDAMQPTEHLQTWTADGSMHVGFFAGNCHDFMQTVMKKQANSRHFLGTPVIQLNGDRARAQTYALLMVRVEEKPGPLDLLAHVRYHDMLQKVDGAWKLHKRYAVFEKDRVDFVAPAGWKGWVYKLLQARALRHYKPQARHLSFVWDKILKTGSPPGHPIVDRSVEVEAIEHEQTRWLATGEPIANLTVVDALARFRAAAGSGTSPKAL